MFDGLIDLISKCPMMKGCNFMGSSDKSAEGNSVCGLSPHAKILIGVAVVILVAVALKRIRKN